MNLSTHYLGFALPHPLMPGASPLVDDLDAVRRLEDAGAAAIVMHSLFEEQIARERSGVYAHWERYDESFAEARTYAPHPTEFVLGPDRYLEQIRRIKEAVSVPVIASLNGTTPAGWLEYAGLIEEAGADAIELNAYLVAGDPEIDAAAIEGRMADILRTVRARVTVPLAVKLSPFFTSMSHLARRLDACGADGLVLFNRFYQADIDIEHLETVPRLHLSDSSELLLRLHWTALLAGRVQASLAVTGGVHTVTDVVRAVMSGAHVVQVVSALLQRGIDHLRRLHEGLAEWLEEHEYESLEQMRGSMSLERCPDPTAFERGNYVRILQSWRG